MPFQIIASEEISHRTDFSILANARGYVDAVEIGTDLGVFAADFLRRFEGNWLFCVDPYAPCREFPFDRSGDLVVAIQALMPFHGRFRFVRARSVDSARWVPKHIRPEFVYVDGSHEEADVMADLLAWWPTLPDHGMLAGHDFDEAHPGVVSAVTSFAESRGLTVRLTQETASPPSWYIYRREPEQLFHRFFRSAEGPNPLYVGDGA